MDSNIDLGSRFLPFPRPDFLCLFFYFLVFMKLKDSLGMCASLKRMFSLGKLDTKTKTKRSRRHPGSFVCPLLRFLSPGPLRSFSAILKVLRQYEAPFSNRCFFPGLSGEGLFVSLGNGAKYGTASDSLSIRFLRYSKAA